ncbi:MAG: 6-bladed beta-propeller [Candidatus Aminicenantales bacterium]
MDDKVRVSAARILFLAVFLGAVGILAAARARSHPASAFQNQKPAPAPVQVKALIFKEELSIGVPEGDENYMFGSSVIFNVDDQDNIYATDWESKQIKKFGPDGRHILTFGRAGQGPGEFQNPGGVRFAKDGALYISENFGNKIMFFDEKGVFLRQSTLPADIFDIWITPAGTYLGTQQIAPQYVGQGPVETFIKIFDGRFKPIVELHRETFSFPDRSLSPAGSMAKITNEFLSRPTALAVMGEEGRIYFGRSDAYSIDVLEPDGKRIMTISRAVESLPYKKADIDFFLKEDAEKMASLLKSESLTKEYTRLIRFPKNKPLFRALVPMEDGMLAVVVDMEGYAAALLDLFDRAGEFLGRAEAAVPPMNLMFKNGRAYALHKDENGFLSIKRYGYQIQH